jgi:hypothetical protein
MKGNKRKVEFTEKAGSQHETVGTLGRAAQDVLGGDILNNKKTRQIFPYLLFLAFLAFVYITNDYVLENKVREIAQMERQIKELRFEYISVKSDLMTLSKQSQLEQRLESMGIKENKEPVKTIVVRNKKGE